MKRLGILGTGDDRQEAAGARFPATRDPLHVLENRELQLGLWDFPLRDCEGGVEARRIGLSQRVLEKPACRMLVTAAPRLAVSRGVPG